MFELGLMCPQDRVETVSDALEALDALSVCVEDADAQSGIEQAIFGEPGIPTPKEYWPHSRVTALFASRALAQSAWTLLLAQDFFSGCRILGIQEIPAQDWVRVTQSQFKPVEITPEFWIVPSWHEPPAQARIIIRLDPGLAFGTGTHPTTRICLRWIARHHKSMQSAGGNGWGRVLDYGCGSGILAIGAAKHGAVDIVAVDTDQDAIESTVLNAQANQVHIEVGLPAIADGTYRIVLANILATPLKMLAPRLWSLVAPGGFLALSGILKSQADELTQAYGHLCQLHISDEADGWILMTATR